MHAADHALPREFLAACFELGTSLGCEIREQPGHHEAKGRMTAGIRQVGRDAVDARRESRFDLVRSQAAEMILGCAHEGPDVVLDVLRQPAHARQRCLRVAQAERWKEA